MRRSVGQTGVIRSRILALGAVVALTTFAAGAPLAGAVVGGAATADAVDVSLNAAAATLGINVVGGTADIVAPAANGTATSGAAASVVGGGVTTVTTSVVDATATRSATALSASSAINNTAVGLLGTAVSSGVINSTVNCPLTGSPTASASVANLVIGGAAPINLTTAGTSTATGNVTISSVLLGGGTANVAVAASTVATTTPTAANAIGLRLTFTITNGTLLAGAVDLAGTVLGTVVLAESVCTSPTGPDPAPSAIVTITPNTGPTTGGTATTITGTGFNGATAVTFDGAAGTSFTVVNDTTITVTTPAGTVGPADVIVVDATGNGTLPAGFTYTAVAPSAALTITPNSGPTTGGTATTITGTGFNGATGVTFDGAAGTGFTVVNDTTIWVATPAGSVGPADVVVLDAAGNGTIPAGFTYMAVAPSSIATITPNNGPTTGNTVITITGSGFTGATGVTFDGTPGTMFTVVNDSTIRVAAPAGVAGTADVVVTDPAGNASSFAAFTYNPLGTLPATGGPTTTLAVIATLVLLLGVAGNALSRRRLVGRTD